MLPQFLNITVNSSPPRARPEDAAPTSAARSDEAPGELNYEALLRLLGSARDVFS